MFRVFSNGVKRRTSLDYSRPLLGLEGCVVRDKEEQGEVQALPVKALHTQSAGGGLSLSSLLQSSKKRSLQPQLGKFTRGLQTGGSDSSHKEQLLKDAASIVQRIDAAHFTEVLHHEAQTKWNMTYDDFEALCIECGAATSKEDAEKICEALNHSGVILRIKNLVYLRPLEVAEILYKALPDTSHEVRQRLDDLKLEAAPLLEKKADIDAHANRYAKTILWTGFAVFTAQMILYARLTFWELSWDVMEPVTYFTSATFAILAYIYCMWHNEEFGILSAKKRINSNMQEKKYAEKGLDLSKLDFLLHRINRLEATLSPTGDLKSSQYKQTDNGATVNSKKGRNRGPLDDPTGVTAVGTS